MVVVRQRDVRGGGGGGGGGSLVVAVAAVQQLNGCDGGSLVAVVT
jgi:hypothetical protein